MKLYGIACVLTMGKVYKVEAESEKDAKLFAAAQLVNDNIYNFDPIDTQFTVIGVKDTQPDLTETNEKENDNGT